VIDKNVANLSRIARPPLHHRAGRAVWSGTSEQLIAEPELQIGIWDLRADRRRFAPTRWLAMPLTGCHRPA